MTDYDDASSRLPRRSGEVFSCAGLEPETYHRVIVPGAWFHAPLVGLALIGDYSPEVKAHVAIPQALALAAKECGCVVEPVWLRHRPYSRGTRGPVRRVSRLLVRACQSVCEHGGCPGRHRFARVERRPFLGTCGGFQHALIEFARHVLGLTDADHAESNPGSTLPVITPLACALRERSETSYFSPAAAYRRCMAPWKRRKSSTAASARTRP